MRAETTHQMKGKTRGPSEKPFEAVAPKEPVYVLLGCIKDRAWIRGTQREGSRPIASSLEKLALHLQKFGEAGRIRAEPVPSRPELPVLAPRDRLLHALHRGMRPVPHLDSVR